MTWPDRQLTVKLIDRYKDTPSWAAGPCIAQELARVIQAAKENRMAGQDEYFEGIMKHETPAWAKEPAKPTIHDWKRALFVASREYVRDLGGIDPQYNDCRGVTYLDGQLFAAKCGVGRWTIELPGLERESEDLEELEELLLEHALQEGML